MTYKQLLFHSAAREKILRGAKALADAVRITLGPKSKSVLIEKKWGRPLMCNDGVTIAQVVRLPALVWNNHALRQMERMVCASKQECQNDR